MPPATLESDIKMLQSEIKDLKGRIDVLSERVDGIDDLAQTVENIELAIEKVSQTADQIFAKLAGSLNEKGLIFKQSDAEQKIEDLECRVRTLWEDRIKLYATVTAVSLVVSIVFAVVKAFLM